MMHMKHSFILIAAVVVMGCATNPQPTPTQPPFPATAGAVVVVTSTAEPIANPTDSPALGLATAVPIPTLLPTITTVAEKTTPAAEATHAAAPAATVARAYRFPAPVLLGPSRPTVFKDGNDITFTYASVGRLVANQCYLLHVEMINPNINPGNRGDDFLDQDHCGDQSVSGKPLTFVLYKGKYANKPNYGTILPLARDLAPLQPKQVLQVTWYVRVVQNNGLSSDNVHYQVVPLSLPSAVLDFDFEP